MENSTAGTLISVSSFHSLVMITKQYKHNYYFLYVSLL